MSRRRSVALLVPLAMALGACGSSSNTPTQPSGTGTAPSGSSSAVTLSTSPVGDNEVLVNSQGRTLYTFAPDQAKKVTCTGSCATVWPPVKIPAGQTASASAGVKASLVSSLPDPAGGQVVTYNGWPLYTYKGDSAAGSAKGQGLTINGGTWWMIGPSGTPIRNKHIKKTVY